MPNGPTKLGPLRAASIRTSAMLPPARPRCECARTGRAKGDENRRPRARASSNDPGSRTLRERIPETRYESSLSTVRVRLPDGPAERFRAVVAAAEAILELASEP